MGEGVNTSRRPRGDGSGVEVDSDADAEGGEGAAQRVFTLGGLAGLVRGAQVARRSREVDLVLELEGRLALVLARGAEGVAGVARRRRRLMLRAAEETSAAWGWGKRALRPRSGRRSWEETRGRGQGRFAHSCRSGSRRSPSVRNPQAARGASSTPRRPRRSARRPAARRTTPAVRRKGRAHGRVRGRARALARRGTHARVARVHFARSRGAGAHGKSPDGGECGPRIALSTREGGNTSLALDATSGPRFCSEMLTVYNSRNVPGRVDTAHARDDVDLLLSRHEKRFFSTTTKKAPDRCGEDRFHAPLSRLTHGISCDPPGSHL